MDIYSTISVCDCCALMVANHDDSSCRDYYGHTHKRFDLPGMWAPVDTLLAHYDWTCDGCDEKQGTYAPLNILTLVAN